MKKYLKLLLLLAVIGALLLVWWMMDGMPLPTAKAAFHRMEQRQLLEESRVLYTGLVHQQSSNNRHPLLRYDVKENVVIGLADQVLRIGLTQRGRLLWHSKSDFDFTALPLEEPYTLSLLPWETTGCITGLLYTEMPYHHGMATLTVQGADHTHSMEFTSNGEQLAVFVFEDVWTFEECSDQPGKLLYELRKAKVTPPRTAEVSLEITLYDETGGQIAHHIKQYPVAP